MGGLRKRLPVTFPVFLVGALAISGVPFLSGFFSKDAILTSAFAGGHYVIYGLGLAGAVLTAFYMFRLIYLTFYGQEKAPLTPGHHVHESPRAMTVPLVILAVFSALAGFIGLPVLFGARADVFGRFLEGVLGPAAHHLERLDRGGAHPRGDDLGFGRPRPGLSLLQTFARHSGAPGSPLPGTLSPAPGRNTTSTRPMTPSSSGPSSAAPDGSTSISTSRSSTARSTAPPRPPAWPARA